MRINYSTKLKYKFGDLLPGTSAELAAIVTDETGSPGSLVFSGNPTLQGVTVNGLFYQGNTTAIAGQTVLSGIFSTDTAAGFVLSMRKSCNAINGPNFVFVKSRGTAASPTVVVADDAQGSVAFAGYDGTNYTQSVQFLGYIDGAVSSGVVPGRVVINTMNSSGTFVEAFRINSSQVVTLGGTSTAPALKVIPAASQARWIEILGATSSGNPSLGVSAGSLLFPQNIVLPKTFGYGIYVDPASPSYSWRDLEGPIQPKSSGAGSPTWTTWSGNIKEWKFIVNDIIDSKFHWPHDWAGTDVYLHIHWSHNGTAIAGTMSVNNRYKWGKGHKQQVYDAEKTITVSETVVNIIGHPALETFITEVQLSAASPSATQIATAQLEPDGLLKMSSIVTSIPTVTGGDFFIEYIDIHYQSTNLGTKQKAPNFYI